MTMYTNKIVPEQHGFYKNRSTKVVSVSKLFAFQCWMWTSSWHCTQICAKAFDSVCHLRLIQKLELWVFVVNTCNGLHLISIEHRKCLFGCVKRNISLLGCPSRFNLGPILFYLFVNDIVTGLNHCKWFKDIFCCTSTKCLSPCSKILICYN